MDGFLWDRPGVWVWGIGFIGLDVNRTQYIQWAKQYNIGWFTLQVFNGDTLQDEAYIETWRDEIRFNGLGFSIWGVLLTDPEGDADRASNAINLYKPDFFIANAEDAYKTDSGGVRARSATFVSEFRAQQPYIKSALSSHGAAAGENVFGSTTDVNAGVFDYKSWYDAGFHWMPQAYYNQSTTYEPNLTVRHARRAGWPYRYVHPTIGVYGIPNVITDTPTHRVADYRPMIQEFDSDANLNGIVGSRQRGYGWSCFHITSMNEADFQNLGKLATEDKASRAPRVPSSYYDVVTGHNELLCYYRMNHTGAFEDEQVGWAADATYVGSPLRGQPSLIKGDSEEDEANWAVLTPRSCKTSNGNYLSLGTPFALQPQLLPQWTIEAWVQIDTNPGGSGVISRENTIGNIQWELGFDADGTGSNDRLMGGFYDFSNGGWAIVRDTVSPTYGVPLHIALTWDGTTLRLYKNGASVGTPLAPGRNPPTGAAGNHFIGHRHDATQAINGFPGWVQDVAYYAKALHVTDLLRHYNAGLGNLTINTKRTGGVVRVS